MGMKDLKLLIAKLHGISLDCLERRDVERRAKTLLMARLSTESLRIALKEIYVNMDHLDNLDLELDSCGREVLVDILLA